MPAAPVIADSRFTASQVGQWVAPGSGLTMFDVTGHGLHGALTVTPTHTIDDLGSHAIQLDGSSYILVGTNDNLNMHTSDWSIFVRFRYKATVLSFPQLVNKYGGAHGYGFEVVDDGGANDGQLRMWIKDASTRTNAFSAQATAKDGNWHNAVATWDRDGSMTIYLDGVAGTAVSISSYSATDITNTFNCRFGAGDNGLGTPIGFWTGMFRDVRIWNRLLSGAEAIALSQPDVQSPRGYRRRSGQVPSVSRKTLLLLGVG